VVRAIVDRDGRSPVEPTALQSDAMFAFEAIPYKYNTCMNNGLTIGSRASWLEDLMPAAGSLTPNSISCLVAHSPFFEHISSHITDG
jgi:hypothetical protein